MAMKKEEEAAASGGESKGSSHWASERGHGYSPRETRRIMKNVVVISFAFLFLFTAFQSMASLQSSINSVDGLGPISLAALYAGLVASCMFLPTILINHLTVKYTMMVCMLCYAVYIGAQFYPEFYTLVPAGVVLGLGAAPMWSAKCTYLTQVGKTYAELSGADEEATIVRFFGIFFFLFQTSGVIGNIISSSVLQQKGDNKTRTEEQLAKCGIEFCPGDEASGSIERPSDQKIYTLATVYLICALAAPVIIFFLVDPLKRYGEKSKKDQASDYAKDGGEAPLSGMKLLTATFAHMIKPQQMLVIPLTFWSGIEQGYFSSEFTKAFIACSWGTENIGWVLVCYGVVDACSSYSFGYVIKFVGRVPIFLFAAALNLVMLVVFFTWMPNPDEKWVLFICAGIWGMADAVWQTQINALYGILFSDAKEPAFSNYRLWESLGFIAAYLFTSFVCLRVTTWIAVGVLLVGMSGYGTVEYKIRQKERSNANLAQLEGVVGPGYVSDEKFQSSTAF